MRDEKMAFDITQLPDWLPDLERLDSYWGEFDRTWAPYFNVLPDILVIHSASTGNWPSEFLSNPINDFGHLCPDGETRSVAAAHICFYQGLTKKLRHGVVPPQNTMRFVQTASLRRSVPHVGGSTCIGDKHPNKRSYGIELPANFNAYDMFQEVLSILLKSVPSLDKWTMHKTISNDGKKTDPVFGSGFNNSWMEKSNLKFVGREAL
jgi:hypothetical protein